MSMSPEGPGWWQASDGRWYPPHQHPSAQPPAAPPVPPPGSGAPPGPGWPQRWGVLIALAVVVVVLFGAAVVWLVVALSGDDATGTQGDTSVYDLDVGDCFDDPTMARSDLVEVEFVGSVPCDQPHDAEVYAVARLARGDDAEFPGDEQVASESDELCLEHFDPYVGVAYDDSSLEIYYYLPTSDTWADGDRMVTCVLIDMGGEPLAGSMEGSGR